MHDPASDDEMTDHGKNLGLPTRMEMVDSEMAKVLRQKTEGERLAIAWNMWRSAQEMIDNLLRSEHPDWSDERITGETARRMAHHGAG